MIVLDGIPFARKRPRAFRFGTGIRFYDPQQKLMDALKAEIRRKWTSPPLSGPLCLEVVFYLPIPASWSKKKRAEQEGAPHARKPDLSNLLKGLEDCMNGIVYHDDSQLYEIKAEKLQSSMPRTEFLVRPRL